MNDKTPSYLFARLRGIADECGDYADGAPDSSPVAKAATVWEAHLYEIADALERSLREAEARAEKYLSELRHIHELMDSNELTLPLEAVSVLFKYLGWSAGGLASAAIETVERAEAAEQRCVELEQQVNIEQITHANSVNAMTQALQAAEASLAECERDAERYRWLRNRALSVDWSRDVGGGWRQSQHRIDRSDMDESIDAAIKEGR